MRISKGSHWRVSDNPPGSVLAGIRAVRDILQQRKCFSRYIQRDPRFPEIPDQLLVLRLQFPVLCPQPGKLRGIGAFPVVLFFLSCRIQASGGLLPSPVLQVRMVEPFFPQQRAALGAALGQRVERRQDPRLVRGGERPVLRPARLPAGHLTIMPRDRGLVGECHRHCLSGPISPGFTTENSCLPGVSCESGRQGPPAPAPPRRPTAGPFLFPRFPAAVTGWRGPPPARRGPDLTRRPERSVRRRG